ncbi:hypothetical protein PTTG_03845 [Puccinia triticina 1-1 BBBD Race 1]|uniref:Uncharacterized protein n=1 Tax=Puccinia triticina (isolate 1-1 / race 1 (BBBD)) TaxID=630390 RepID=A0A180GRJ0_PUCT1|nr:hypothetical protein PTTG_03845 [Puccinia triticina 1-1 BBBD Race 1]
MPGLKGRAGPASPWGRASTPVSDESTLSVRRASPSRTIPPAEHAHEVLPPTAAPKQHPTATTSKLSNAPAGPPSSQHAPAGSHHRPPPRRLLLTSAPAARARQPLDTRPQRIRRPGRPAPAPGPRPAHHPAHRPGHNRPAPRSLGPPAAQPPRTQDMAQVRPVQTATSQLESVDDGRG